MSETKKVHGETGFLCLVAHRDGYGPCIQCMCGKWVRPQKWEEHINATDGTGEQGGTVSDDNFSHRAGYHTDPLDVAMRQARKGGTLAAGEGAVLVQEIERLTARAERAEAVLARLKEPSQTVLANARNVQKGSGPFLRPVIRAAVAAAEAEVSGPQPSRAEPTATDVLFPGVQP